MIIHMSAVDNAMKGIAANYNEDLSPFEAKSFANNVDKRITFVGHAGTDNYGDEHLTPEQFVTKLLSFNVSKDIEKIDLVGCEVGMIVDGESYASRVARLLHALDYNVTVNAIITDKVDAAQGLIVSMGEEGDNSARIVHNPNEFYAQHDKLVDKIKRLQEDNGNNIPQATLPEATLPEATSTTNLIVRNLLASPATRVAVRAGNLAAAHGDVEQLYKKGTTKIHEGAEIRESLDSNEQYQIKPPSEKLPEAYQPIFKEILNQISTLQAENSKKGLLSSIRRISISSRSMDAKQNKIRGLRQLLVDIAKDPENTHDKLKDAMKDKYLSHSRTGQLITQLINQIDQNNPVEKQITPRTGR